MVKFFMSSMARSGETMMLRCFDAHSKIVAVGEGVNQKYVNNYDKVKSEIVVIKQGTYEIEGPFFGFVLSRSPLSIYRSLLDFSDDKEGVSGRLRRWMKNIDSNVDLNDGDLMNFCNFYNRRMGALFNTGLPIVRYEDVVKKPKKIFSELCKILKIEFESDMINSHKFYKPNTITHAKNDLGLPIHTKSLNKWKEMDDNTISKIIKETKDVYSMYGYHLSARSMKLINCTNLIF